MAEPHSEPLGVIGYTTREFEDGQWVREEVHVALAERYEGLVEQFETLRTALRSQLMLGYDPAYGVPPWYLIAQEALRESNPAKEYEYVEDTAEGRWGTASSPASRSGDE